MEVERVLAAYPMGDGMAAYFIYSHLEGVARREVQLREMSETNTPEKMINILRSVFGDGRRVTVLLSLFYSCVQRPGESIVEYSHALRDLERSIRMKDAGALTDDLVKEKFIEGLFNVKLKRELRHLVRRKPRMTFYEIRDEALIWLREEELLEQEQVTGQNDVLVRQNQILLLESQISSMQEILSTLEAQVSNSASVRKRKRVRRKRKRKRKSKLQSIADTRNREDSNPRGSDLRGFEPKVVEMDKTVRIPWPDSSGLEESESQEDGWVCVPIPSRTGVPGPSMAGRIDGQKVDLSMPVTEEESPQPVCELVLNSPHTTVSHPKEDEDRPCQPVVRPLVKIPDRNPWPGRLPVPCRGGPRLGSSVPIPAFVATCG